MSESRAGCGFTVERSSTVPGWPIVTEDDPGLREQQPGECFYCGCKIGSPHGDECVIVEKKVLYDVFLNGDLVGTFERLDPYFWNEGLCEFHKNDSSWCQDNGLDAVQWLKGEPPEIAEYLKTHACVCGLGLEFKFNRVTDVGPIVQHGAKPECVQPTVTMPALDPTWNERYAKAVIEDGVGRWVYFDQESRNAESPARSIYVKVREGNSAWQNARPLHAGDVVIGTIIEDYDSRDMLIGIEVLGVIDVTIDGDSVFKAIDDLEWIKHDRR